MAAIQIVIVVALAAAKMLSSFDRTPALASTAQAAGRPGAATDERVRRFGRPSRRVIALLAGAWALPGGRRMPRSTARRPGRDSDAPCTAAGPAAPEYRKLADPRGRACRRSRSALPSASAIC